MSIVLIIFLRDSDPLYVKIVNNYVQVYSENTSMKTKVSIFKIGNLDYSKRVKTGGKRIHKKSSIPIRQIDHTCWNPQTKARFIWKYFQHSSLPPPLLG